MQMLSVNVSYAAEKSVITGDSILDGLLLKINTRFTDKTADLVSVLSREYLVPENKITNLLAAYEFTPADVFLTVAVADLTGQPVDIVSRAYLEHKSTGWSYVLEQLNILPATADYDQLIEDADMVD